MSVLLIIAIIEALCILVILIKRKPRYDGAIIVMETEEKKIFSIEIASNPDRLDEKKKVVLQVTKANF